MIVVITGMPGGGKTYTACDLIVQAWKANPNKKIFTNFPVKWKNKSTMKWDPRYVSENLVNSLVVIDEAYRTYNSRKFESFSDDAHLMFATSRHNENSIVFISQNLNRLDKVIREIAEIWWVSKVAIPNPRHLLEYDQWRPIWFTTEVYDCEDSLKMRLVVGKKAMLKKRRTFFRKKVAEIYDTHYYGRDKDQPFVSEPWFTFDEKTNKRFKLMPWLTAMLTRATAQQAERFRTGYIYGRLQGKQILEQLRGMLERLRRVKRTGSTGTVWKILGPFDKVWEPRSISRTIIYGNWMIWKPIFIALKIEKTK